MTSEIALNIASICIFISLISFSFGLYLGKKLGRQGHIKADRLHCTHNVSLFKPCPYCQAAHGYKRAVWTDNSGNLELLNDK